MPLSPISVQTVRDLIAQGAMLIDIRSVDEYAREHIAEARHIPMERISENMLYGSTDSAVIFYCRSGNRTRANAQVLASCITCKGYVLEGGLDAWKKAGLAVKADPSQPLELQRQVQISTGLLIVLGTILGTKISPWFLLLSGFVGAGLVFAGVSGFCGLAHALMLMPWNRRKMNR